MDEIGDRGERISKKRGQVRQAFAKLGRPWSFTGTMAFPARVPS